MGLISLCGDVTKKPSKTPREEKPRQAKPKHAEQGLAMSKACTQCVDITINGKNARVLVDNGAEANLMAKTAATRLGLRYSPSNINFKMINAPPTPMDGVAHGVSITKATGKEKPSSSSLP